MLDVRDVTDVRVIADERVARAQLRRQVAALEAQLSDAVVSALHRYMATWRGIDTDLELLRDLRSTIFTR